jgi:hypothetical protein
MFQSSKQLNLLTNNTFIFAKLILETLLNGLIIFQQFHKSWILRVLVSFADLGIAKMLKHYEWGFLKSFLHEV